MKTKTIKAKAWIAFDRETESILRGETGRSITVTHGTSLYEDIAAADVVLSMHSTALEEAYLAGRPVIQVRVEGFPLTVDFRTVDAPLARTPEALVDRLLHRDWMAVSKGTADLPTAADAISGLLSS